MVNRDTMHVCAELEASQMMPRHLCFQLYSPTSVCLAHEAASEIGQMNEAQRKSGVGGATENAVTVGG